MTAPMIYSLGSGRSGSTVIERVLASSPQVVSVGEIHALWRLPIADLVCSCGVAVPDCDFWRAVFDHAGCTTETWTAMRAWEASVVRNTFLTRKRYDMARYARDSRVQAMGAAQAKLFAAIRTVSGCPTVLDSSKAGPRAWLLAATGPCAMLHVYRDPADVMASWRSRKFDPSLGGNMARPSIYRAAVDWAKANAAARQLARCVEVNRVNYTEFADRPRQTLTRLMDRIDPEIARSIPWETDTTVPAPTGYHSVLGNPDRFDRAHIEIKASHSALPRLSGWDRAVIRSVAAGLRRAFP